MRICTILTILCALLLTHGPTRLAAQGKPEVVQADASGTEFYIAIPPNEILPYPVEGLEIYVASAFDANVELYDYAADKATRFTLKPFEIRTLSDRKELNWSMEVRDAELPVRKALRIKAEKPIVVNVINSKALTTDGFLAIPTAKWGTEYIAASYWDFREVKPWPGGFIIIAREPTEVKIQLRGQGKDVASTSNGRKIGDEFTVALDEGEVYMVHGDGQTRGQFDLTGSLITSDKPIGVIGFHMRTTVPNLLLNGNGRNHLCEMLPPTNRWGRSYATLEFNRNRLLEGRGDVFRVVAKDADTRWTCKYYEKSTGKLLGQRGGLITTAGGVAEEQQATQPTALVEGFSVWEADKPILLMQYSCSSSWDGDQILDPFMICVTPREQFVWDATFQAPTMAQFSKNNLNLVIQVDASDPTSIEENLKSLEVDGVPVWNHPKALKPTLLNSRMPNGDYFATIDFGTEARSHSIRSNGLVRFGGYLYGFGAVDAYGWPLSSALRTVSPRDTNRPVIAGTASCGDYSLEVTDLRNLPDPPAKVPQDAHQVEQGIAMIDSVRGKGNSNYRLVRVTDQVFPERQSYKKFSYRWEVIDKSKDARVVYYVVDHAGNMTLDTCMHKAVQLATSAAGIDYGKIRLGSTSTRTISMTNNAGFPIRLTGSEIMTGSRFKILLGQVDPKIGIDLVPGASHTFSVEYTGSRETRDVISDLDRDTLVVTTTCGNKKLPLSGAAAIARIAVANWDAGQREIGESHCAPLTVKNPGSDTLIIAAIRGFANSAFSLSSNFTPALPIVIKPRDSVAIRNVCFKSDASADSKTDVTFTSNADGPDSVSTWTGTTLTSSVDDELQTPKLCAGFDIRTSGRTILYSVSNAPLDAQLTIHDLQGQVVATSAPGRSSDMPTRVGPLPAGTYIVSYRTVEASCSRKILVGL